MAKQNKASKDWSQVVTNHVLEKLQQGCMPWIKPWTPGSNKSGFFGDLPYNGKTGRQYSGTNIIMLSLNEYCRADWYTYAQAKKMGANVRKGEKGTPIIFAKQIVLPEEKRRNEDDSGKRFMLRGWSVFNAEQIDGLPPQDEIVIDPKDESDDSWVVPEFEQIIEQTGATIKHRGSRACYLRNRDRIELPSHDKFKDSTGYYATVFHELGHWTGHSTRLDRKMGKMFGDAEYAFEELVAEMTSAFCCRRLGMQGKAQHVEYINHWIKLLKSDKKALVRAAKQAQKAFEMIMPQEMHPTAV